MKRKKRNSREVNSEELDYSDVEEKEEEQTEPSLVEDEVESHRPPAGDAFSDILGRARDRLMTTAPSEAEKPRRRNRYQRSKEKQEAATVIASLLTLLIASWRVPDELKPNEDETNALANYATRLLLRHVDLSGRLTADALDVIGILAVMSSYYARTASGWRDYRDRNKRAEPERGSEGAVIDPIQNIDPNAAEFLSRPRNGGDHE